MPVAVPVGVGSSVATLTELPLGCPDEVPVGVPSFVVGASVASPVGSPVEVAVGFDVAFLVGVPVGFGLAALGVGQPGGIPGAEEAQMTARKRICEDCFSSSSVSWSGLPGRETTMLLCPRVVTSASLTPVLSTRSRMMFTACWTCWELICLPPSTTGARTI